MKEAVHPTMVRIEKRKFLKIKHELVDKGVTVNAFINTLIDTHLKNQARIEVQRGKLAAEQK